MSNSRNHQAGGQRTGQRQPGLLVPVFALFLTLGLLLSACQRAPVTPEATPVPPTPSRRPRTPTPVLPLVSSPKDLEGYWHATQNLGFYFHFLPDGTYKGDFYIDEVDESPDISGEYWVEDSQLHMKITWASEDFGNGCVGILGIYQVQMQEDGNLNYMYVQDNCAGRRRGIVGLHEARP